MLLRSHCIHFPSVSGLTTTAAKRNNVGPGGVQQSYLANQARGTGAEAILITALLEEDMTLAALLRKLKSKWEESEDPCKLSREGCSKHNLRSGRNQGGYVITEEMLW